MRNWCLNDDKGSTLVGGSGDKKAIQVTVLNGGFEPRASLRAKPRRYDLRERVDGKRSSLKLSFACVWSARVI